LKDEGISGQQAHRILEDFQRLGMVFNILIAQQKNCKNDVCRCLIVLGKEEADAIYRDMTGMLNGNFKKR